MQVWLVQPARVRPSCLAWLTEEERAKIARHATPELQAEYFATRVLSRWALSQTNPARLPHEWVFERTEEGKPFVPGGPHFNLSNHPGLVGCVVANDPVGLDIEILSREVNPRALADSEKAELAALPELERSVRAVELWSLKEAYLKARGDGIAVKLRTVVARDIADWTLQSRRFGRYVVAVAARSSTPLTLTELPELS